MFLINRSNKVSVIILKLIILTEPWRTWSGHVLTGVEDHSPVVVQKVVVHTIIDCKKRKKGVYGKKSDLREGKDVTTLEHTQNFSIYLQLNIVYKQDTETLLINY